MDESQWIRRAQQGDFEAFAALVESSQGKVYHHLLRLMGNPEDAQELLQESFLSAFRNLGSFQGDSAFSTWLYRIATNHALMRLRRKQVATVGLDELYVPTHEELKQRHISDWELEPDQALLRSEVRQVLNRAIQSLPPAYRSVTLLRDVEELSTAETAAILDISEGAVKTRLHRARLALREKLAEYFERPTVHEGGGA